MWLCCRSLDEEFVALCCPTAEPLSDVGDGSKFEKNQGTGDEKTEYKHVSITTPRTKLYSTKLSHI